MRVFILNEMMELSNEVASIDLILEKIRDVIESSDYHLSSIAVDELNIYDDYKEYISDHIRTIQEIKIELRTSKQQYDDLILDASRYLTNAIPEVAVLADEFYRNPDPNSWLKLGQLFEGLQWFQQIALNYNNELLTSVAAMRGTINELEGALQSRDIVLIADLLQFEIKRQYEDLQLIIGNIIDNEVVRHDLN